MIVQYCPSPREVHAASCDVAPAMSDAEVDRSAGATRIHELLDRVAVRTPGAVAIVDERGSVTYAELAARARVLARRLVSLGCGQGALVAVHMERSVDSIAGLYAASLAGLVYLPIDAEYAPARIRAILDGARPAAILTRAALADRLPHGGHQLLVTHPDEPREAPLRDDGCAEVISHATPDDPAYVIFTSGSTGVPKGVVVDHRSLCNYVTAAIEAYRFEATDRVLHGASIGFDLSIEEILVTLCSGAALVLRSGSMLESVASFLGECERKGLTIVSITSVLWHELTARLDDGSTRLPSALRLVILGADAARADVLPAWQRAVAGRVRLVNSYGLTETTVVATVWEASEAAVDESWRSLPIGRPLRNVSVYVLDPQLSPLPVGAIGEICVGGLAVARGYLDDETLTRARFVDDPFSPGARMYRTGDRGRLRSSGELEFLGRVDHQVKIRGHRVELGEIEARLRERPGVREAVVVRMPERDDELVAFLTHDGAAIDRGELKTALSASLPAYMVPARFELLEVFPLTSAGKIDRRKLAESAAQVRERRDSFVAPRTPFEQQVAAVLAEALHLPQIGLDDRFTDLGCTSLAALRAASVLGARLTLPVGARLLYESTTVRELAAVLQRMASGERASLDREAELLERDARLDPSIGSSCAPRLAPPQSVLLTGATGFFGSFLLLSLLEQTDAHIHCLVRAATPDQASKRLRAALAARFCRVDAKELAERVTAVPGDLTEPWLGLREPLRTRLAETVDVIHHAGATVSYVLPYSALRQANTLAVERILRFAVTGRPKRVHHVSTIAVVGSSQGQVLADESCLATTAADLADGYARSKWAAERLAREAMLRGLDVTVYRPGRLMGHSRTGAFNPDDFLVQLLATCVALGAAPDLEAPVDVTPVDFASNALVELSLARSGRERVLHLLNPHPIEWRRLVAGLVARGFPLRLLPHAAWRAACAARAAERGGTHDTGRADGPNASLYLASLEESQVVELLSAGASCERTALWSRRSCPPVDDALLDVYVSELSRAGVVPTASRSGRHRATA